MDGDIVGKRDREKKQVFRKEFQIIYVYIPGSET